MTTEPTPPVHDRPRERLARHGPDALQDAELLALVLGCGTRGAQAAATGRELLARFRDLGRLASAGLGELTAVPGVGWAQACRVRAALALADRLASRPLARGDPIGGPEDVVERLGRRLRTGERERFVALALDARHRVLTERLVAEGGVCSVPVVPRDAFSLLVREAAAGVIFVHNHPSGDPAPSAEDERATAALRSCGDVVGVRVVDHVIVAREGWHSFAQRRTVRVLSGGSGPA